MYYSKSAEQRAQQQRLVLAFMVMMAGIGAGTVLALLLAPKSGEQTRRELTIGAEKAFESGRDASGKAIENLQKEVERLRREVEERVKNA
jgi:gas vesicle protein